MRLLNILYTHMYVCIKTMHIFRVVFGMIGKDLSENMLEWYLIKIRL